ncbi:uncharacterized protein YpmB [Gracilibacillus halotolerans]|uniref:Uncharacterized protein YpmB n=1 Tax=Gracilibacillus halotolerans TaxID=74386 RepID=A0A841RNQ1_9BACI|nr:hypothetical protein [Gracilibacillus halotolerans]MBB6512805.1 uncharacterized protein YpmB [Gracilibacillus halotolerans]
MKMKKKEFAFILIVISIITLVACGDLKVSSSPEIVVHNMYKSAVENNQQQLDEILTYFSHYDGNEAYIIEELKDQAYDLGGTDSIKPILLKEDEMQREIREGLDATFSDNWNFVYVELGDSYIYAWIVQEIDGNYYIVEGEDFSTDEIFLIVDGVNLEEERAREEAEREAEIEEAKQEELVIAKEEAQAILGTWKGTAIAPQQAFEMTVSELGETEIKNDDGEEKIVTPFTATAKLYMNPSTVSYSGWHPVTVDIELSGNHIKGLGNTFGTIDFEVMDHTPAPERDFKLHGIHFYPISLGVDEDDLYEDYFLQGEMQGRVSVSDRNRNTDWSLEKVE